MEFGLGLGMGYTCKDNITTKTHRTHTLERRQIYPCCRKEIILHTSSDHCQNLLYTMFLVIGTEGVILSNDRSDSFGP